MGVIIDNPEPNFHKGVEGRHSLKRMRLIDHHIRATQWAHVHGAPRSLLFLHDFLLFAAAVCGALAAFV